MIVSMTLPCEALTKGIWQQLKYQWYELAASASTSERSGTAGAGGLTQARQLKQAVTAAKPNNSMPNTGLGRRFVTPTESVFRCGISTYVDRYYYGLADVFAHVIMTLQVSHRVAMWVQ